MRDPTTCILHTLLRLGVCLAPLTSRVPQLMRAALATAPRRACSRLLISFLLLIAPISFSTDRIPNFHPDCTVATPLQTATESRRKTVYAVLRPSAAPHHLQSAVQHSAAYTAPVSTTPGTTPHYTPAHNRAPPSPC